MLKRTLIDNQMQPGLSELKAHLRIMSNDNDTLLTGYLRAACYSAEKFIGELLETSTFILTTPLVTSIISLPEVNAEQYPLISVDLVEVDGVELDTNYYSVSGGAVTLDSSVTGDKVRITYKAGGIDVDPDVKVAILLIASKYFNNPVDSVETLPTVSQRLLRPHRNYDRE